MAEPRIDVARGLAAHITKKEKSRENPVLRTEIMPEAGNIALRVGKIVNHDTPLAEKGLAKIELADYLNNRLQTVSGGGLRSIEELNEWVEANQGRIGSLSPQEVSVVQLAWNLKDGIALGMVANAGKVLDPTIRANIKSSTTRSAKEQFLNNDLGPIPGSLDVLNGFGAEAAKSLITRSDVILRLNMLQEAMDAGNVAGGIREAVNAVSRLREKNSGSEEIKLVFGYVNALQGEIDMARGDARRLPPELRLGAKKEDGAAEVEEFTYDMKRERFTTLERQNKPIRWYDERPPRWYEEMSETEQSLIDFRVRLLMASGNKESLRNVDVTKLRANVPEIANSEMLMLWKDMPGFKEALRFFVKDLAEEYVDPDGRILLRFKTNGLDANGHKKPMMEGGQPKRDRDGNIIYLEPNAMTPEVRQKIWKFSAYRKEVAEAVQNRNPGVSETQAIEATSVAFEWLYVGDFFESLDYFRQSKPTPLISDKLRTIDHPMIKALGKWGAWKGYMGADEIVTTEGQEEPFISGDTSSWVLRKVGTEKDFRQRLVSGDLKDMMPRTMCVSMIECTKIGDTNWATALLYKSDDWIEQHIPDNDDNIMQPHNDMVQGAEGIFNIFKGKIPFSMAKGGGQFISDFVENTSLIRQEPNIPIVYRPGPGQPAERRLGTLAAVDKPEFFAWAVLIATGFNYSDFVPLPDAKALGTDYDAYDLQMKDVVSRLAEKSSVDQQRVLQLLAADSLVSTKARQAVNSAHKIKKSVLG